LLGASDYSARLAAKLGLPYVFAHHFSGEGTEAALAAYRAEFRPSAWCEKPTTFLTVNVVVADTQQEAVELATPNLQNMARLVSGQKMGPVDLVEDALALDLGAGMDRLVEKGLAKMVIGTADQVGEQLRTLAKKFDVDEIMLHPVASARRDEDPRTNGARVRTLELAAEALGN
ncbi:MAG: LLM class flavin-dependent oxidoreductase, partial [Actinomycetales bacterium]|nr:LLM class flavin-dependent oxidoreductase [Actinomycetales bacterium]